MDSIVIQGRRRLCGEIKISGAKNAALPVLCASILAEGRHEITNIPQLRDIQTTLSLLEHLGLKTNRQGSTVSIENTGVHEYEAPYDLVKKMRASVLVLGPLVARYGRARVSMPGGCAIGARPIDQHVDGLKALGASVLLQHGYVDVTVPPHGLRGADIALKTPSVTGTENLLCAATLARGETILRQAAREPEIVDLACALRSMGAVIEGDGTDTIRIVGQSELGGMNHSVMPDRIEAGTYMAAVAATGGEGRIVGARARDLGATCDAFRQMGIKVEENEDVLWVSAELPFTPINLTTAPFPGFPTDMQAQLMVLMCMADGQSKITETIFENRFMHVGELRRMAANISLHGREATISGPTNFQGAEVMATDLRASACLVIAALVAEGSTQIRRVYHLDRGYEGLEHKLAAVGASVRRIKGGL
ncbi:MAG: UDP-N-acetylglucosamine 1-carboxyvinyltransferase [Myxococcales bacterium]|nr:MAG: UDP-N-acetylglucosamine 1-carboxyvinyltransferase [Myxococcales bacterium]